MKTFKEFIDPENKIFLWLRAVLGRGKVITILYQLHIHMIPCPDFTGRRQKIYKLHRPSVLRKWAVTYSIGTFIQ